MLKALLVLMVLMGVGTLGTAAWVALRPPPAPPPPPTPLAEAPPPPPAPATMRVVVAAQPLRAGALLKPSDIKVVEREAASVPEGARLETASWRQELVGAMIRRFVEPNEPILPDDVLRPGDRGFLAAVLGPDMRAVTVAVDAVTGQAGLIWPGDRVDVLLTQEIRDPGLPPAQRVAGETVLMDVRVIAVDRNLVQGGSELDPRAQVRTVTLEVTQRQAEKVMVASRLGRLSLSVRSPTSAWGPATAEIAPAPAVTWGGDVSSALRGPTRPAEAPPATIRVFQGQRTEEFRF